MGDAMNKLRSEPMTEDAMKARKNLLETEIVSYIKRHHCRGTIDQWMHQILIMLAAVSVVGVGIGGVIFPNDAQIVGLLGAVPGLASVLSQQLHCVEAANFHFRRATEAEALRIRLLYELPTIPNEHELAKLAKDFSAIDEKLISLWEQITRTGSKDLGKLPKAAKATKARQT
jgi:hypothetical protein